MQNISYLQEVYQQQFNSSPSQLFTSLLKETYRKRLFLNTTQILILVLLSIACILPSYFYVPPYSTFYSLPFDKLEIEAKQRQQSAFDTIDKLLETAEANKTYGDLLPFFNNPGAKNICVGIMTKSRPIVKYSYLMQTVVSLLTRTHISHEKDVKIWIYHSDVIEKEEIRNLTKLLYFKRFNYDGLDSRLNNTYYLGVNYVKQYIDYIIVGRDLLKENCKHYLILEDDAIVGSNWVDRVYQSIDLVSFKSFYIKFYWDLFYHQWQLSETSDRLRLLLFSFLFSALVFPLVFVFIIVLYFCGRYILRSSFVLKDIARVWVDIKIIQIVWLLCLGLYVLLWVGKPNIFCNFGKGLNDFSTGYGNVAMLYPHTVLKDYMDYADVQANSTDLLPIDIILGNFIMQYHERFIEYLLHPPLFQHIGFNSNFDHVKSYNVYYEDDAVSLAFDENIFWETCLLNRVIIKCL